MMPTYQSELMPASKAASLPCSVPVNVKTPVLKIEPYENSLLKFQHKGTFSAGLLKNC
jgi:hypothetical protein